MFSYWMDRETRHVTMSLAGTVWGWRMMSISEDDYYRAKANNYRLPEDKNGAIQETAQRSNQTPIEINLAEPYRNSEWVAALAGLALDPSDSEAHMRLHNTISFMEHDIKGLLNGIERIAEHADVDGVKHIANQLRELHGAFRR